MQRPHRCIIAEIDKEAYPVHPQCFVMTKQYKTLVCTDQMEIEVKGGWEEIDTIIKTNGLVQADPDVQVGEFICNIHLDYMTYTVEKIEDQYITHYENEYCKINHPIRKDGNLYKCCGHSHIYETRDKFMEYLTNRSSDIYYTTEPMKKLDVFKPHTISF